LIANWGHWHCYIRSWPTVNSRPTQTSGNVFRNPDGMIHTIAGTGGPLMDYDSDACKTGDMPAFIAKKIYSYGYLRMNVMNETTIHFAFHGMNEFERPMDEFWIVKN